MLFNEPKLLKFSNLYKTLAALYGFSALQRAEIAEMYQLTLETKPSGCFSALQRAEIAEMLAEYLLKQECSRFSALQRAEIAEITIHLHTSLYYN